MGFRKDAYATVWSVECVSDTHTKARISISRKNRMTDEFETDFSGFVSFIGSATAKKAACLKERERIKLGDVDVSNKYDKEKNITYTNFKIFSFEEPNAEQSSPSDTASDPTPTNVDDGEQEETGLPF